jgi:Asp-tRNA(Asn)/Glu-tRNA(Gln) amidotransferase A subunit family amidase
MIPNLLTASDALAAMEAGGLDSETLVGACLRRIDEREKDVHAWASIDRDGAIAAARDADRARRKGATSGRPLLGLPVGIKDNIDTADLPTELGSPICRGRRPGSDAPVVELLRHAGAIVLGKTETVEFAAFGRPAPTRNPIDLSRTPGGSSSGSAAAVADFMVPVAFGTQTGGSLIRPGSYCGCVAFKPSYGTVSTESVKLISVSLDTVGWYARAVSDVALVARALEVIGNAVPDVRPAATLKLGICRTPYWSSAHEDTHRALDEATRRFREAGAKVSDVALDDAFADAAKLQETIMSGEGYFAFLNLFRAHSADISENIRRRMMRIDDGRLLAAIDRAAALRPLFDRIADGFDAIVVPSAQGQAPADPAASPDPLFNGLWTMLHLPCITLPGLVGSWGMPVGIQLVGCRRADGRLLAAAAALAPLLQPGGASARPARVDPAVRMPH